MLVEISEPDIYTIQVALDRAGTNDDQLRSRWRNWRLFNKPLYSAPDNTLPTDCYYPEGF